MAFIALPRKDESAFKIKPGKNFNNLLNAHASAFIALFHRSFVTNLPEVGAAPFAIFPAILNFLSIFSFTLTNILEIQPAIRFDALARFC